jgi:NTE family protein
MATTKDGTSNRGPVLVDFALQAGAPMGPLPCVLWIGCSRRHIDGISGTSTGAMNAAVPADGHAAGGAEGARAALESFWRSVSRAALLSPLRRGFLDVLLGRWSRR